MTTLWFYLGFVVLFSIGYPLIKKGKPYTRSGGDVYVKRKKLQHLGVTLVVASGMLLVLAVWSQVGSTNGTEPVALSTNDDGNQNLPAPDVTPRTTPGLSSQVAPTNALATASASDRAGNSTVIVPPTPPSPVASAAPIDAPTTSSGANPALPLTKDQQLDAKLVEVNAFLKANPDSALAYGRRGDIYAAKKMWAVAERDFQTSLQIDGNSALSKFNLAQMQFAQKQYALARPGFVPLEQNSTLADIAKYKVFLCDLLGGHEDIAAKELDAFNQVGEDPSYYFANATWSLYHKNVEDARGWLVSASHIYAPQKFDLYAENLVDLGYLPLPPPP
jgi:cytoskeletal protein RodZ